MLTVTYLNLDSRETETNNFANYAVFEVFEDSLPIAVMSYEQRDEEGRVISASNHPYNCGPIMRACLAGTDEDRENMQFEMSRNAD